MFTAIRPHVRWLVRRDMPEVLAIDHASFGDPWNEEAFLKRLRERNCIGMCCEDRDGRVVGFMVYTLGRRITVDRLAVHPDFRRQGVGRALVAKLRGKLDPRRNRLVFDVPDTNLPAQLWLRKCGVPTTIVVDDGETYRFVERYGEVSTC